MLVNGKWSADWQPVQATDEKGGFVRQVSGFRNWVTPDGAAGPTGEGGFKAQAGRYHLYVSLACPWAHRTLIYRKLKGLESLIDVSVVSWLMAEVELGLMMKYLPPPLLAMLTTACSYSGLEPSLRMMV